MGLMVKCWWNFVRKTSTMRSLYLRTDSSYGRCYENTNLRRESTTKYSLKLLLRLVKTKGIQQLNFRQKHRHATHSIQFPQLGFLMSVLMLMQDILQYLLQINFTNHNISYFSTSYEENIPEYQLHQRLSWRAFPDRVILAQQEVEYRILHNQKSCHFHLRSGVP